MSAMNTGCILRRGYPPEIVTEQATKLLCGFFEILFSKKFKTETNYDLT